jgi:hypothetical protein
MSTRTYRVVYTSGTARHLVVRDDRETVCGRTVERDADAGYDAYDVTCTQCTPMANNIRAATSETWTRVFGSPDAPACGMCGRPTDPDVGRCAHCDIPIDATETS